MQGKTGARLWGEVQPFKNIHGELDNSEVTIFSDRDHYDLKQRAHYLLSTSVGSLNISASVAQQLPLRDMN